MMNRPHLMPSASGPTAKHIVPVLKAAAMRTFAAPLLAAAIASTCTGLAAAQPAQADSRAATEPAMANHPYVGMWVTEDGYIRHELLPENRYDEARGDRASAYRGRYEVTGNRIEYWDDTGFTADGVFVSKDVLHHGGMVFRREAE